MGDLIQLLTNIEREAFRLELLEEYKVGGEWEQFQRYLKGQQVEENPDFKAFCDLIAQAVKQGRSHARVHVVPSILTPYLRFEIETGYMPASKAGAAIYLIERIGYSKILADAFESSFYPNDFWLFDENIVVELKYDEEGRFVGESQITRKDLVRKYVRLKDILLEKSAVLKDWLKNRSL